jgi:hypothetical protein
MLKIKNSYLIKAVNYSSKFSYKSLPKESKELIDKIIRVDHAGKKLDYSKIQRIFKFYFRI